MAIGQVQPKRQRISTACATAAMAVVANAGHVIELADSTHFGTGVVLIHRAQAAAISVWIDQLSSSLRSMPDRLRRPLSHPGFLKKPVPRTEPNRQKQWTARFCSTTYLGKSHRISLLKPERR